MTRRPDHEAQELSAAWDRLIAGQDDIDLEPSLKQTLDMLSSARNPDPIETGLQESIWANVVSGTATLWRPDEETVRATTRTAANTFDRWSPDALLERLTRYAWVVTAGMLGGFIAGIGARLFMRLAGYLTPEYNRFLETENGETVGEITLAGTISLGFVGAGAGIVTILIYLALRNRLPFDGWRRSAGFGVLLLLVFGYVIMDPSNPDYQLFGPTWLNVSTFSSLYLLMGFCCSQVYELGHRIGPGLQALKRSRLVEVPLVLASGLVCAFGALVSLAAMFVGAPGMIVVAVAVLAWLADRYIVRGRIPSYRIPAALRPWGMLVVPGLLGFVLTARGIAEILLNR